jgi:Protein of unknown function (DUF1761)
VNILRIFLASIGAFVAYFVAGGAIFGLLPSLKSEFLKYPAVYRDQQGQMSHMPVGMVFMFLSMVALAVLYALSNPQALGMAASARAGAIFGVLIGIFFVGTFVVHNFVNLQIGLKLTVQQAVAYFAEWVIVGIAIGLIYRPTGAN